MSTLTILIIIVAGVAVAYLLEIWSENGYAFGGVSNRKLSRHLFSPFPNGFYTCYDKRILLYAGWTVAIFTLCFLGLR